MAFFDLDKTDGEARAGTITTAHGVVSTPCFMPVATLGAVRGLLPRDLRGVGASLILGNAYHLSLLPGHELIERVAGGLHRFMDHEGPILTDSGGYQVFSLAHLRTLSEEGVRFRSPRDGSLRMISPEVSMEIQRALGSDIVMCFDDCPAADLPKTAVRESMERTIRWADRCLSVPLKEHQHLFAIVQGGLFRGLRKECLERLAAAEEFTGWALGGLSVGEKNEEMMALLANVVPLLPIHAPRYLMGVGTPIDILEGVALGLDLFDCVLPTRDGRHGRLFTRKGPLSIKREQFKEDMAPPDPACSCETCRTLSRAYLRHLFKAEEPTAGRLASLHNLHFYLEMMGEIRKAILKNSFDDYRKRFYKSYTEGFPC